MYITYDPIDTIQGFGAWLYSDWDFVNRFSIREFGLRLFGFTFSNFSEDKANEADMIKLRNKQYKRLRYA